MSISRIPPITTTRAPSGSCPGRRYMAESPVSLLSKLQQDAAMGNLGELSPCEDRGAAGFVESVQQLKEHSGLTFRELEERAALSGDVLARSTLAGALRRRTLSRPGVLAAFVRAGGAKGQRGLPCRPSDRLSDLGKALRN
jgi:hypothetical protein